MSDRALFYLVLAFSLIAIFMLLTAMIITPCHSEHLLIK